MANVTIILQDPTSFVDNSPATASDCSGLNIYRADNGAAAVQIGKADPSASPPTFVDQNIANGSYVYTATAVNTAGVESSMSQPVSIVVGQNLPQTLNPPTIVSATQS